MATSALPSESCQSCDYYFDSYAHYGIHGEMIKDTVRTTSYLTSIEENPEDFVGKVVLDVGCGTGILSMFAARAGARKIYAVEASPIVEHCRKIVELNGFAEQIQVVPGDITKVDLPEKVDVIISEWMGYALIYENMLTTVLLARDRFLKPGGRMFPARASMFIAGIEDAEYRAKTFDFWDNVYGFDFSPIKAWALSEPLVERCPRDNIMTSTAEVLKLDLMTVEAKPVAVDSPFTLTATSTQFMHAIVVWFTVEFVGSQHALELSTSPLHQETHWKQSILYLETPVALVKGRHVTGQFRMVSNPKNPRDLDFDVELRSGGTTQRKTFKMR